MVTKSSVNDSSIYL